MSERKRILSVTAADCELHTFRVGGAGGQHRDKTSAGVRWVHPPSGASGSATDSRSQWQNKKAAWKRMVNSPKFQLWLKRELGEMDAERAELERRVQNQVERDLRAENLRWEYGDA